MSRTDSYGRDVHDVGGPFSLANAKPASPSEGGTLDRGIVATLGDGRRVVIGEIWAMGPASDGARISLDAQANAAKIVELLNGDAGVGTATTSGEEVVSQKAVPADPPNHTTGDRSARAGASAQVGS